MSVIEGLSVLITGELPTLTRPQAQELVTQLGGRPVGSVSKSTGLVVMGEGAGVSKTAKIKANDLPTISAEDFEAFLFNPSEFTRNLGVPFSEWSATQTTPPEPEEEPQEPFADRHLVGQVNTYPVGPDGVARLEYRLWCLKCGHRWAGQRGPESINDGCPNDPKRV